MPTAFTSSGPTVQAIGSSPLTDLSGATSPIFQIVGFPITIIRFGILVAAPPTGAALGLTLNGGPTLTVPTTATLNDVYYREPEDGDDFTKWRGAAGETLNLAGDGAPTVCLGGVFVHYYAETFVKPGDDEFVLVKVTS